MSLTSSCKTHLHVKPWTYMALFYTADFIPSAAQSESSKSIPMGFDVLWVYHRFDKSNVNDCGSLGGLTLGERGRGSGT